MGERNVALERIIRDAEMDARPEIGADMLALLRRVVTAAYRLGSIAPAPDMGAEPQETECPACGALLRVHHDTGRIVAVIAPVGAEDEGIDTRLQPAPHGRWGLVPADEGTREGEDDTEAAWKAWQHYYHDECRSVYKAPWLTFVAGYDAARLRAAPRTGGEDMGVLAVADRYRDKWQERDEGYWLQRLMQEVGELASVLAGDHEDTVEHELTQVASIAINWLRKRAAAPSPATGASDPVAPLSDDLADPEVCKALGVPGPATGAPSVMDTIADYNARNGWTDAGADLPVALDTMTGAPDHIVHETTYNIVNASGDPATGEGEDADTLTWRKGTPPEGVLVAVETDHGIRLGTFHPAGYVATEVPHFFLAPSDHPMPAADLAGARWFVLPALPPTDTHDR